jgi:hypothetical protein
MPTLIISKDIFTRKMDMAKGTRSKSRTALKSNIFLIACFKAFICALHFLVVNLIHALQLAGAELVCGHP